MALHGLFLDNIDNHNKKNEPKLIFNKDEMREPSKSPSPRLNYENLYNDYSEELIDEIPPPPVLKKQKTSRNITVDLGKTGGAVVPPNPLN